MPAIMHSITGCNGKKLSSGSDHPLLPASKCSTQSAISADHAVSSSSSSPSHLNNTFQVESSVLEGLVTLYPHQVGGHVPLLAIGRHHICKPFHEVEHSFYRSIPECLREFTPCLCLEAEISLKVRSNEVLVEIGSTSCSTTAQPCRYCTDDEFAKENVPSVTAGTGEKDDVQFRDVSSGLASLLNPWAFHCQMKCFGGEKSTSTTGKRYLILENLTAQFRHPCILDMKLGTRQHSDAVCNEKKWHQQWKCLKTTSNEMGLRVCGMQYFDAASTTYQCMDKYAGRQLDKRAVRKLIRRFFTDSHGHKERVRLDVCAQVLARVRHLSKAVGRLDGYRFFGASLLVIYEGDDGPSPFEVKNMVEVRLIDFANITIPSARGPNLVDEEIYPGPDTGCLLGLKTLESILTGCRV